MAPGTILLKEALPLIEVPRVFHKITREWQGRTAPMEGHLVPEEIVFPDQLAGKQALILATDV